MRLGREPYRALPLQEGRGIPRDLRTHGATSCGGHSWHDVSLDPGDTYLPIAHGSQKV